MFLYQLAGREGWEMCSHPSEALHHLRQPFQPEFFRQAVSIAHRVNVCRGKRLWLRLIWRHRRIRAALAVVAPLSTVAVSRSSDFEWND